MKTNPNHHVNNTSYSSYQYELIKPIGQGGCGCVYKARNRKNGRIVAIKMLPFKITDIQKSSYHCSRFEKEILLSAQLKHPNIVQFLDGGYTEDWQPFAVFEYISGETLKNMTLKHKGLTPSETGIIMGQLLDALAHAHNKGVIHRDLKPQNIMVINTNISLHAKLLDFGIGVFTNENWCQSPKPEIAGTPAYCAPEQLKGLTPTTKSDLYSWGLILLECLTGQRLGGGSTTARKNQKQHTTDYKLIPSSLKGHPLYCLLQKVLQKNPKHRFSNTTHLVKEYANIDFNNLQCIKKQQIQTFNSNNSKTITK